MNVVGNPNSLLLFTRVRRKAVVVTNAGFRRRANPGSGPGSQTKKHPKPIPKMRCQYPL